MLAEGVRLPSVGLGHHGARITSRASSGRPGPTLTQLQRARVSIAAAFFVYGAFLSTWVSRIPVIQHELRLGTAQLGVALIGPPIGQVLAMQLMPGSVRRWSSATTARWAAGATGTTLVLLGLARNLLELTVCLTLFGFALGGLDICMNTQGVAVERRYKRPLMSGLHGVYSVGVLVGASLGALAAALSVEPVAHFALAAGMFTAVSLLSMRDLLGRGADQVVDAEAHAPSTDVRRLRLQEHPLLIIAGFVAFCAFFAEGAVDNWSGVFLHQHGHASYGIAPLGVALTGIGMAIGRFTGDALISRLGRRMTLLWASLVSSGGMVLAVLGGSIQIELAGYAVFGLGVATIVPIAFTNAGNTTGVPPAWALSRASTMGYVGQLSSPALIGLVAHLTGLSLALAIPIVLLLAVAPLSQMTRDRSLRGTRD